MQQRTPSVEQSQPTIWENIFVNDTSDKGHTLEIFFFERKVLT